MFPVLRVLLVMAQEFAAHGTAARMKVKLRALVYDHLLSSARPTCTRSDRRGAAEHGGRRGAAGHLLRAYLPQLVVAAIAPVGIFVFMAWLDLALAP